MMRLLAVVGALTLFATAVATAPLRPIAAGGGVALLFAVAGIVTLRRWLVSTAASVFVADYALALRLADSTVDVIGGTAFGIALLLLLQPLEVARCGRRALDVGVTRSQLRGWLVFGVAIPGVVVLAVGLSHGIATSVPALAAPLLAAAGAIGVLLGLAAALTRHSPDEERPL
jgi:hypothetical protein